MNGLNLDFKRNVFFSNRFISPQDIYKTKLKLTMFAPLGYSILQDKLFVVKMCIKAFFTTSVATYSDRCLHISLANSYMTC